MPNEVQYRCTTYCRVVVDLLHGVITKVETAVLQVLKSLGMPSAPTDRKTSVTLGVCQYQTLDGVLAGLTVHDSIFELQAIPVAKSIAADFSNSLLQQKPVWHILYICT